MCSKSESFNEAKTKIKQLLRIETPLEILDRFIAKSLLIIKNSPSPYPFFQVKNKTSLLKNTLKRAGLSEDEYLPYLEAFVHKVNPYHFEKDNYSYKRFNMDFNDLF